MELSDIKVTVDNYMDYQFDGRVSDPEWDRCYAAHMTLNDYLAFHVGDCGGSYATWLESMGFAYMPENSIWWGYNAVNHVNIKAFIDYETIEEFRAIVDLAIEKYKQSPFTHDMEDVEHFLRVFG